MGFDVSHCTFHSLVDIVSGGLEMPETIFFIGLFIIVIVALNNISDIVKKKYQFDKGDKVSQEAIAQVQADLNALQKSVNEMKEYLTDLYIQQHDKR